MSAQIDEYYSSVNPANSSFVNDLKARIRSPYTKISYDQFDETNVANFASYVVSGSTRGVRCVYSWYEYTYTGTFAWGTFSREHTWCHSWMPTYPSTTGNEYSDQHHLFPTHQNGANGVRSNHPLGNVLRVTSSFLDCKYGYNATTGGYVVFEPRNQHKGDAARALLYMCLRYDRISSLNNYDWSFDNLNNVTLPGLSEGAQDLNVLLQWHRQDPPDKWEVQRNNYVQGIQQNRNPFVDHPEYVNYINFGNLSKLTPSYATEPSNHVTGITKSVTSNSITLSWTNSTGDVLPDGYLVEVYDRDSYYIPIDGYSLTENTNLDSFKVKYVTHSGSATSYTFTGLTTGKTYYFSIYPYKGSGSTINYLTTGSVPRINALAGNAVLATEPTNQPTGLNASGVTTNAITLNWTDAAAGTQAPSGYLVLANNTNSFTDPSDGTAYTDDSNLADGSAVLNIGTGIQKCTFSSLIVSTTYYFRVYSYNGTGGSINYKTGGVSTLTQATAGATEQTLLISEYVEGSSNNKALELYNASTATIDLANFKVSVYYNGATTAGNTITFPASTFLAPGKVYVVANSSSGTSLISQLTSTNTPYVTSSGLNFNGDDAIILFTTSNDTVDVFGQVGVDPGTGWSSGGVSTVDKSLRRKNTVYSPRRSNGVFDPSAEFTQYNTDDFSGLGTHDFGGTISGQTLASRTYTGLSVGSGTLTLGGNSVVLGNLTLSSGSVIQNEGNSITVKGNITGTGSQTGAGKIVLSEGSSAHVISASGTLGNIEINDAVYGASLGSAADISGTLTLTKGNLNIGNYNLSAGNISGGSPTSCIITEGTGTVKIKGVSITKKAVPLGLTGSYNPVSITNSGTTSDFTLTLNGNYGTGLNNRNLTVPRLFGITPSGSGSNCTLELQIYSGDFAVTYNTFDPAFTVKAGHTSGENWSVYNATVTGTGPYTVTVNGVTAFSTFAVGNPGAFSADYDVLYSQNFDGEWTGADKSVPPAPSKGAGTWTIFPATGNNSWRSEEDGSYAGWTSPRAGNVRPYGNTGRSANFHTYGTPAGDTGVFELTIDLSAPGNKVLSFDYSNASGNDTLEVYFSEDGLDYGTAIAKFGTGPWSKKTVTLGQTQSTNCGIRFRAVSDYGSSDIGIDNVEIKVGNIFVNDAGVSSVDINTNVSGTVTPKATVKNYGSGTAGFYARMLVDGVQQGTDVLVENLGRGASRQVLFADWTPVGTGAKNVTVKIIWAGDENPANDELQKTVNAVVSDNWSEKLYTQSTYLGSGASSTTHLYSTGGVTTEGSADKCYKIDAAGNVVSVLPNLPSGRTVHASAIAGGYLYVIGGRMSVSPFSYTNTVYRFDINSTDAGNNWAAAGVTLPQNIGWCKAVTYSDRYIYLAGGYNGSQILNTVYMYDVQNSSAGWVLLSGTLPGGRYGGAFSIAGRKLVYIAGASGTSTFSNSVFVGTISESDPKIVTWEIKTNMYPGNGKEVVYPSSQNLVNAGIPESQRVKVMNYENSDEPKSVFPPGSLYGLDAVSWGSDKIAVGGGTNRANFTPQDPSPFYLYDPVNDAWTQKTDIPSPVAGSSAGSINSSGENLKFISAFGMTYGDRLRSVQVWNDALSAPSYKVNVISLPEINLALKESEPVIEAYIELRESVPPYNVSASKIINQNPSGFGSASISGIDFTKSYFVVVRYLNGIETWSSMPQYFSGGTLEYDFTSDSTKAYGENMHKLNGKWCIIIGDINQDGSINSLDRGI